MPSLNTKLASAPNTTANYVLKATTSTTIGNSLIFDNGSNAVGINTTSPSTFANYTNLSLKAIGASGVNLDFFNSAGTRQASIVLDSSNAFNFTANAAIPLVFGANDAERMRITSTGNVGIANTNPFSPLHINSNGAFSTSGNMTSGLIISNTNFGRGINIGVFDASAYAYIQAAYVNNADTTFALALQPRGGNVGIGTSSPVSLGASYTTLEIKGQSGLYGGAIQLTSADGTNKGRVYTANDTFWIGTSNSLPLGFITADTERMRITSGGNVLIGQSSGATNVSLKIRGIDQTSSNYSLYLDNGVGDLFSVRNDGLFQTGNRTNSPYNASISGRPAVIDASGTLGYTSSTRESKANIENLNDISWVYQLNPVSFNYRKKDDEMNYTDEFYEDKWYGLIADEVESVNQDLVFYNTKEDGNKTLAGVEYNKLISALVKAIQELNQKLQDQQQTINSLINR
jgi:hypothetical protein